MNIPAHVQEAFDRGEGVSVEGKIVTNVEEFLELYKGSSAEVEQPAPSTSTEQKVTPKQAELKKANDELTVQLAQAKAEAEGYKTAASVAVEALRAFVPTEPTEVASLSPEQIDAVTKAFDVATEGASNEDVAVAIVSAVHPTQE